MVNVSSNGLHVWGVNRNNNIYYRRGFRGRWIRFPGKAKFVDVSGDGSHVWAINSRNNIFHMKPRYIGNRVIGSWRLIGGKLKNLDVSSDGSKIFGVNSGNAIFYKNGVNGRWIRIQGGLKQIAIA